MNSDVSPKPAAQLRNELSSFVAQLGQFFSSDCLVQFDCTTSGSASLIQHTTDGIAEAAQEWYGNATDPRLPMPDGSCDTIFNLGSLGSVPPAFVDLWVAELHRLTGRNLWVVMAAAPGRDQVWWEKKFFEAGFRKHPLMTQIVPYPAGERDASRVTLVLEKIPAAALARYPLAALKAERDLHMDMLRESGVRSEAHLARYQLAARHAESKKVILDAACGLGYGSAMLARQFPDAHVIGIDLSEYAIEYARTNFAGILPNLEFHVADACDLTMVADDSVDLVVSFETIEHLPDPSLFLRGVLRRMKAGAMFLGSVPNLWLDETGKDPNPWHFHVFDLPKFYQFFAGTLHVANVYRENAGGHLRARNAGPDLREVRLPVTDQLEEAEWWIIAAQKTPAVISAPTLKPRIWLIDGDNRAHLYADLKKSFDAEWLTGQGLNPENIDLAVVSDEWYCENSLTIQQLRARGVPTLHVVDGVVDWKNTWENPRSEKADAGVPLFQPVLCDKIACLGQSQARILAAWGNAAKCEVVGVPRFDRYFGMKKRVRAEETPARILIMTANTPYFNDQQHTDIVEALRDIQSIFAESAQAGIPIEPVWRVTGGLEAELGLNPSEKTVGGLAEVLASVDAVICSSSTAMLEAMLLGLPTALLDYSNVPHYLQPPWRITAAKQIAPTLGELLNPSAAKMLHQEMVLHDSLECASPATLRLVCLVGGMVDAGRRARQQGTVPSFAPNLLQGTGVTTSTENRFNLSRLHPDHPSFRINSITQLQAELNQWQKSHAAARKEVADWRTGTAAGAYVVATIQWRSKFEAAMALVALKQPQGALELLLQSLKAVESCKDRSVILEALLEVSAPLGQLDPSRARILLESAQKLAAHLNRPDAVQRAAQLLAGLPATKLSPRAA